MKIMDGQTDQHTLWSRCSIVKKKSLAVRPDQIWHVLEAQKNRPYF